MPTIKSYNKRKEALKAERSTFMPLWIELSDYHLAHRGRFLTSDRNKGHKRNTKQINNSSRLAVRSLNSGMMANISSPARPWFRVGSGDKSLDDISSVKKWNHAVQVIMYKIFAASNFYNSLQQVYSELGVFGTGCMGIYKDFENVIHCQPYTIGSYMLGMDGQNLNDTMYREYELSVAQTVKQFGIDNVSLSVKKQWETGNTEAWVKITHLIEPNDDRDGNSLLAKDKPYRSVYYEQAQTSGQDKFLRESGMDDYPIVAPRWGITGEDVYATDCPGIDVIGDTKALQLAERRKYQAFDKVTSPPLQGPSTMRSLAKSAGIDVENILWYDGPGDGKISSIYGNYRPDIGEIRQEVADNTHRIQRGFYEDLFLMLANSDRRQVTAREVAEKHEEKLLMLGPVLERLHTELLDPVIDRTFNIGQSEGIFPPPPPELQGRNISIEYVSVLAQAQRLVNTGAIDRLVAFTGEAAQVWPEARHKINVFQTIDDYADALGVAPSTVRSDAEASEAMAAEAQQQQQMAMLQAGEQMANTAKTVSEVDMTEGGPMDQIAQGAGLA